MTWPLLTVILLAEATLGWRWLNPPQPPRDARTVLRELSSRDLLGLLDIVYATNGVIGVETPRGTTLELTGAWPLDDVLATLADVEAL